MPKWPTKLDGWVNTDIDTGQYVRRVEPKHFLVIDHGSYFDVDVGALTMEQAESAVAAYYSSLRQAFFECGDAVYEIIAECVAEQEMIQPILVKDE